MKINIKDKLEQKGMSRYELAKRIGVTYPTITSIYNGKSTSIKFEILESICKELDCTPDDIIVPKDEEMLTQQKINTELFHDLLVHYVTENPQYSKIIEFSIDLKNEVNNDELLQQRLKEYFDFLSEKNKKDNTSK